MRFIPKLLCHPQVVLGYLKTGTLQFSAHLNRFGDTVRLKKKKKNQQIHKHPQSSQTAKNLIVFPPDALMFPLHMCSLAFNQLSREFMFRFCVSPTLQFSFFQNIPLKFTVFAQFWTLLWYHNADFFFFCCYNGKNS